MDEIHVDVPMISHRFGQRSWVMGQTGAPQVARVMDMMEGFRDMKPTIKPWGRLVEK